MAQRPAMRSSWPTRCAAPACTSSTRRPRAVPPAASLSAGRVNAGPRTAIRCPAAACALSIAESSYGAFGSAKPEVPEDEEDDDDGYHPLREDDGDEEEEENTYFEFRISTDPMTKSTVFNVTDFADSDEVDETVSLWETQISELRRILGA
jgi:hypothetical protein